MGIKIVCRDVNVAAKTFKIVIKRSKESNKNINYTFSKVSIPIITFDVPCTLSLLAKPKLKIG